MRAWIRALLDWLRDRTSRPQFVEVMVVPELHDLPTRLESRTMYVAGSAAPKWAVFRCPCGRGHVVTLTLQRSHDRSWGLTLEHALPTLHPSIDVTGHPRCHYFIRRGRVIWIADTEGAA